MFIKENSLNNSKSKCNNMNRNFVYSLPFAILCLQDLVDIEH